MAKKLLTFTLVVEVDGAGEKWVPYLRKVLGNKLGWAGTVKSVQYEPHWSMLDEKRADEPYRLANDLGEAD